MGKIKDTTVSYCLHRTGQSKACSKEHSVPTLRTGSGSRGSILPWVNQLISFRLRVSFKKWWLNFQGPPSCYLSTILRNSINISHNDDKSILNSLSYFIIRTILDYRKNDYHYSPFTKEKPWSKTLTWLAQSHSAKKWWGSGKLQAQCPDLCHRSKQASTENIGWEAWVSPL